jgi:hypothetical protein
VSGTRWCRVYKHNHTINRNTRRTWCVSTWRRCRCYQRRRDKDISMFPKQKKINSRQRTGKQLFFLKKFLTSGRVGEGVREVRKGTKKHSNFFHYMYSSEVNSLHKCTCSVRGVPYGIPPVKLVFHGWVWRLHVYMYHESTKWELHRRQIWVCCLSWNNTTRGKQKNYIQYECRCDERLKVSVGCFRSFICSRIKKGEG